MPTPNRHPSDFENRRPRGGGGDRPQARDDLGAGAPVGGAPVAFRRKVYTPPTEPNPSIDAIMRQRPNFTSGGQIAKDGRRVRPRAFRSARKVRGQGERNLSEVRGRLKRYGYRLEDLQRVAQKEGRPSKLESLLKRELDLIIYQECRLGFRRLAREAVGRVLGVTPGAIDKAYKRGERAMLNGERVEARLEVLERHALAVRTRITMSAGAS